MKEMKEFVPEPQQYQEKVNNYFQLGSSHWNDVYASKSAYAEVMRARQAAVLAWVDDLALEPGSRALEIGCGAGFTSIELAMRGLHVNAIDSSEAMVQQACRNAIESRTNDRLKVDVGDVYAMPFEDASFDLVIAIGVFPWLAWAELAIQEISRVTRTGGYVILTTANWTGLPDFLDPQLNPALAPLRRRIRTLLRRVGFQIGLPDELPKMIYHKRRFIDKALVGCGLLKMKDRTLGFAPFTIFCHSILPNRLGLALHHRLQRLADRNAPVFRSIGMTYLVLSRKTALSED